MNHGKSNLNSKKLISFAKKFISFVSKSILLLGLLSSCLPINSNPTRFTLIGSSSNSQFTIPTDDGFIAYKAEVSSENISEYNLILFVDNSQSMSAIKDKLISSLNTLVRKLDGKKINIGVYPITSIIGFNLDYFTIDANNNKDFFDYLKIANIPGGTKYFEKYTKLPLYGTSFPSYAPSYSINRFEILNSFSASEKENVMNGVITTVNALFSDQQNLKNFPDVPLCNIMSMIMDNEKATYPFSKDAKNSTIYMLVSNEDDETVIDPSQPRTSLYMDNCIGGRTTQYTKLPTNLTYMYTAYYYKATYDAEYIIDGVKTMKTDYTPVSYGWINDLADYNPSIQEGDDCLQELSLKTDYVLGKLNFCEPIGNCSFTGTYTLKSCKLTKIETIGKSEPLDINSTKTADNACDSVSINTLSVGTKVIPSSCRIIVSNNHSSIDKIVETTAYNNSFDYFNLLNFDTTAVISDLILNKNSDKRIYFIPIINTQNDNCTLTEGSRKGTKYEKLSNELGSKSVAIPICSQNYEDYLLPFITQNVEKVSQDIVLKESDVNRLDLSTAEIQKQNGSRILLKEKIDYTIFYNKIRFKTTIENSDLVVFYLK